MCTAVLVAGVAAGVAADVAAGVVVVVAAAVAPFFLPCPSQQTQETNRGPREALPGLHTDKFKKTWMELTSTGPDNVQLP